MSKKSGSRKLAELDWQRLFMTARRDDILIKNNRKTKTNGRGHEISAVYFGGKGQDLGLQEPYYLKITEPAIKANGLDCIWGAGAIRLAQGKITGQKYFEELLMDPETVRLDFMNSGYCPVNLGHKGRQVGNIVEGSSFIEDGKGHAKIQFFDDSFSQTIFDEIKNGKRSTALSVAAKPFDYLKLKGKNGNPDTLIFTEWEPFEIALVTQGADPGARILI